MVMTSVRGDIGRDTRRLGLGREGEIDFRRTRQGERGWASGSRVGDRGCLDMKLPSISFKTSYSNTQKIPWDRNSKNDMILFVHLEVQLCIRHGCSLLLP